MLRVRTTVQYHFFDFFDSTFVLGLGGTVQVLYFEW